MRQLLTSTNRSVRTWTRRFALLSALIAVPAIAATSWQPRAEREAGQVSAEAPVGLVVRTAAIEAPNRPTADATASKNPLVVQRVLQIDGPFRHGDFVWDDAGVPDGPIVITADLKAQTLSVFKGGYEIGAAVILYGDDEKPTPTGVYPITQKDADHVSNLYDAPMPYMLRMTNDGVSIHGTDHVEPRYATHGCIGVPVEFARKLFAVTQLGDKIIVTDGKMLKPGAAITAG